MRVMTTLMVSLLAAGCVPKTGDVADTSWRTQTPEPLAPRAFQLPEAQTATLSNGVEVSVVENHEMPLVNVRVAFDQGAWTDSADAVGLASVTLDMLNEGAGEYDAAATPSYGTDTLKDFFKKVSVEGLAGQELGDQAVFKKKD